MEMVLSRPDAKDLTEQGFKGMITLHYPDDKAV